MDQTRIPCASSNFMTGRPAGMRPEAIVLHRTGGSADEIRARFLDGSTLVSAHYVVRKDGGVVNYVSEQDTAFHAGLAVNPTWKGVKPDTNPNFYTIGVELEGAPADPVPEEQSDALAALLADVAARNSLPIDADHIVLHSEIRASSDCPGAGFARADLLQRALLAATSPGVFPAPGEVEIIKDTNLRESLPSSSARVVSVLRAGTKVRVNGFTLRGESVKGNSAWHQTEDGNFFWAGNSSIPQPRPPVDAAAPMVAPAPSSSQMTPIGIAEIDRFFGAQSTPPLDFAQAGRDAIGAIQDLLTGQGFPKLPSVLSPAYGVCGDATRAALSGFQNSCGLPLADALSTETMKQLVCVAAKDPRATRAYFSLVLGIPFTGIHRVLALTAQMEGVGKFAALNLNTDTAGLSFGLIQWAQRPGRLAEIVAAFREDDTDAFNRIFGGETVGDALIAHLKKPSGGVDPKTGVAGNPAFNLIASPWPDRFRQAALHPPYQATQVRLARAAFENSLDLLRQYDSAGLVKSERAVAFMLDVANQFGNGSVKRPAQPPDRGLAGLYRKTFRDGMTEQDLLKAIADASVAAMSPSLQNGVHARRTLFLTTPLLSGTDEFNAG
jgi:hypothetical protein